MRCFDLLSMTNIFSTKAPNYLQIIKLIANFDDETYNKQNKLLTDEQLEIPTVQTTHCTNWSLNTVSLETNRAFSFCNAHLKACSDAFDTVASLSAFQ